MNGTPRKKRAKKSRGRGRLIVFPAKIGTPGKKTSGVDPTNPRELLELAIRGYGGVTKYAEQLVALASILVSLQERGLIKASPSSLQNLIAWAKTDITTSVRLRKGLESWRDTCEFN